MATPNGRGGWDLTDDDVAEVMAASFGHQDTECVWGQGECVPDCPNCKRMDELIAERAAGYREGYAAALDAARDAVAALPAYEVARLQPKPWGETYEYLQRAAALAAIDALRGAE
jgi:hypothetical protein